MEKSTYSFDDVSFVISHKKVGKCTITGKGVGSISIARANDVTQHDVAADGSVMVSKIVTKNGTIALALQQTSSAHKWLKKWYSYLLTAATNQWAETSAVLNLPSNGESIKISGISPQKAADAAYQQAGQQVTWNLMATKIEG